LFLCSALALCLCNAFAQTSLDVLRQFLFLQSSDPLSPPTEADQALESLIQQHAAQWMIVQLPGASVADRRATREALFNDLEAYIQDYPRSRWELSIHLNLGIYYQRQARWSRALPHLIEAWGQSQDPTVPLAHRFADRAQLALGMGLLELGRIEALDELMNQTAGRVPRSPALGAAWRAVREAWIDTRQESALASMLCGAHALQSLARALGAKEPSVRTILQSATAQDAHGFTLARLHDIARRHGLTVQAAVRDPGADWVFPAVVHWRQDLWRTIVAPYGAGCWVQDPTRGRFWMSAEALEEEATGFCLLPQGLLPPGWRTATAAEAAAVIGRSSATYPADAEDEQCPPPPPCCTQGQGGGPRAGSGSGGGPAGAGAGGGGGGGSGESAGDNGDGGSPKGTECFCVMAPCHCPGGLPRWRISEPFINVWLEDEPWGYAPAWGPPVGLSLNYKLRDTKPVGGLGVYLYAVDPWEAGVCETDPELPLEPYALAGTSFGIGWASSWFAFVYHEEGDPDTVTVRTPGRGYIHLELASDQETSDPDPDTGAILKRLRNQQQQQIGWELEYPNGQRYQFAQQVDAYLYWGTHYLLSSFIEPSGSVLQFSYQIEDVSCEEYWYQTHAHLTQITDAAGLTSALAYTNTVHPTFVTSITDPYNRVARFFYDADGYLTNLVDVQGIQTSFQYAGQDPPLWLYRYTTPYGTTEFQVTETEGSNSVTRGVLVFLPEGRRVAAMYYKDAHPNFPEGFDEEAIPQDLPVENAADYDPYYNTGRNARNSYFWGMAQAEQLSTTNFANLTATDLRLARTRHWLLEEYPKPVSRTVSWEQGPSSDGASEGAITWYGHDDKPARNVQGASIHPSVIARVMPDGSTWYQWHQRNFFGHTTNLIERWFDPSETEQFRTNRFIYSTNGLDLITHIGPDGNILSGYAYDSNHPHLPVAITNALGEVTRYFYDTAQNGHRLLGVSQLSGLASTNYYSGNWLASTIDFLGTTPLRTNSYTWQDGRVRTHTDPRGLTLTFTQDNLGRLTRIDFPDSTYLQHAHTNGAGSMLLDRTATRDRLGNWTRFEYNGLRQLTRFLDPLERETR